MSLRTIAPPTIDPADIARALGITADTGADYQFTDAYGVTYTGSPAHLTVSALARRDLAAGMFPADRYSRFRVRGGALLLIDWFTSVHADPEHAAEFAALVPMRVCQLVAYLANTGDIGTHDGVGPASLRHYTDHLLHDSVPNPDHPLPRLFDNVHRSLRDVQSDQQHQLQVIATAPDGDDEIQIALDVEAVEVLSWNFTAPIPYRVDQLNAMLMRSDFDWGEYVAWNRDLVDDHLEHALSDSQDGVEFTATLGKPRRTAVDPPVPAHTPAHRPRRTVLRHALTRLRRAFRRFLRA